jgi:hypothetical protein
MITPLRTLGCFCRLCRFCGDFSPAPVRAGKPDSFGALDNIMLSISAVIPIALSRVRVKIAEFENAGFTFGPLKPTLYGRGSGPAPK